jgi:hypothetical protein
VADLRGRSDGDCVEAMLAVTDAGHRDALAGAAVAAGKLAPGYRAAPAPANSRAALAARLRPLRRSGVLPDYPLGSDFTDVEQRIVRALAWLKPRAATRRGRLALVARALAAPAADDPDAMRRMGLASPAGFAGRLEARMLALALAGTRD